MGHFGPPGPCSHHRQTASWKFVQGCNENQGSQRTATITHNPKDLPYYGSCSGIILLLLYANSFAVSSHLCVSADPSLCNRAELDAPDRPHGADSLLTYVGMWQNSWSSELLELWHVCKPCFQFYSWTSYWSFSDLELTQNLEIRKALVGLGEGISVVMTKKYLGKLF